MDLKITYQHLCEQEKLSVFQQYWWLDAVCGAANWQPILVFDKNQKVIGATYIFLKKKYGFSILTQAPLTPILHVWFRPLPPDAQHKKDSYETDILKQIIQQLPKVSFYLMNLPFALQNHLPFHWAGFHQTTRYTYLIDLQQSSEKILDDFKHNVRTNIKKAQKNLIISAINNSRVVYDVLQKSYQQNALKIPFSFDVFEKLHELLHQRKQSFALSALDSDGNIEAVAYLILDGKTAYFMFSGKKSKENHAAMSLLIWESLQKAALLGCHFFDFDGSVLPKVEPFFQSFGGERKSYFQITKAKNKFLEIILNGRF
jgi:Acetyltransferase (GNAT) domain